MVKVRTSGQGDHCINLPGSEHLATSIATSLATVTSVKIDVYRCSRLTLNAGSLLQFC